MFGIALLELEFHPTWSTRPMEQYLQAWIISGAVGMIGAVVAILMLRGERATEQVNMSLATLYLIGSLTLAVGSMIIGWFSLALSGSFC